MARDGSIRATGDRKRILFPFVGDDVGGSHFSTLGLVEGLDRARFDPVIALHDGRGRLGAWLGERGVPFVAAPTLPPVLAAARNGRGRAGLGDAAAAALATLRLAPLLRRYMREGRFDLLHTNDGRMHVVWGGAALATPTRHVWHHRGDPRARGANWLAPLMADRILTVSRFARPARPVAPIGRRWQVIHSPFDRPARSDAAEDRRLRAGLLDELGLEPSTRFIAFFGLLNDRKRPAFMADIVAALDALGHREVHAVLFGRTPPGGDQDARTRRRALRLGVGDRVHLMGFREPAARYMRAVDVLVVPALAEPFGRTLIEAMRLGLPVVASDHGGNPEAISDGRTGHLVPPEDPHAFAKAIARLLDDEAHRARLTERARASSNARYTRKVHVERVSRVYRELTGEARIPAPSAPAEAGA